MTSDEIKAIQGVHANSGLHCGSDLQALWEIAYQLAVMNEQNTGAESRYVSAVAACRAIVDANDHGMRAEEGRRAVELCRAVVADEEGKR